jgi:hypothetical protein
MQVLDLIEKKIKKDLTTKEMLVNMILHNEKHKGINMKAITVRQARATAT